MHGSFKSKHLLNQSLRAGLVLEKIHLIEICMNGGFIETLELRQV